MPPFRFLPLACAAMVLLLGVKAAGLALSLAAPTGSGVPARSGLVAPASASEPPAKPAPRPAADPLPERAPAPRPVEAAEVSEAEKSILGDLRARREALDGRVAALEKREALIASADRGLKDRLDQLAALQAKLETMEKTRSEREEANWRGLVKTYEIMRPRDAAAIFNDLDAAVLLEVLDRMKEAKTAPILAAMQPDRARTITARLAQWKQRTTGAPRE